MSRAQLVSALSVTRGPMNFYLGVWNSPTAISDDEVAARHLALSDEKSVEPEFDADVYNFYCGPGSLFPEVETVPEDELDSCPGRAQLTLRRPRNPANPDRTSAEDHWPDCVARC